MRNIASKESGESAQIWDDGWTIFFGTDGTKTGDCQYKSLQEAIEDVKLKGYKVIEI
jgi:hypothetical protein